ncbi:MAG: hypothetical protein IPN77_30600 [Sandaracinaceae bacterium]|nr:hypothetical protein [Sandaracinaceae bacterium]
MDSEATRATLDQIRGITSDEAGCASPFRASEAARRARHAHVSVVEAAGARATDGAPQGCRTSPHRVRLSCDEDATFLGFGAQYNATDQRGEAFDLFVEEQGIGRTGGLPLMGNAHSTYFPVPYWLDARGFGVAHRDRGRVSGGHVCADDMESDARGSAQHAGGRPGAAARTRARATSSAVGRPLDRSRSPPAWGFGPWLGIRGARTTCWPGADAAEAAQVPPTALWAGGLDGKREFVTSGEDVGVQYRWTADDVLYPDLAGMIETLHGRGIRFLGYANPFVQLDPPRSDHAADAIEAGHWSPSIPTEALRVSRRRPRAARSPGPPPTGHGRVHQRLPAHDDHHLRHGWTAGWRTSASGAHIDAVLSTGRDPMLAHNTFPTEWHQLSREVFEEERPDGDWAVFTRSGWAGEQGVAQIVWIGDQEADFLPSDGLPTVVPAMINLGLTGMPFVTRDIAGFSGGPSTKELWLRWCEAGRVPAHHPLRTKASALAPRTGTGTAATPRPPATSGASRAS